MLHNNIIDRRRHFKPSNMSKRYCPGQCMGVIADKRGQLRCDMTIQVDMVESTPIAWSFYRKLTSKYQTVSDY